MIPTCRVPDVTITDGSADFQAPIEDFELADIYEKELELPSFQNSLCSLGVH